MLYNSTIVPEIAFKGLQRVNNTEDFEVTQGHRKRRYSIDYRHCMSFILKVCSNNIFILHRCTVSRILLFRLVTACDLEKTFGQHGYDDYKRIDNEYFPIRV